MAKAKIRPVRSEKDYEEALARINALMDAVPDSPEFEELDDLVDLVELYEGDMNQWAIPAHSLQLNSAWIRQICGRVT